ncbi:prohibitin family protein [Patescibacteria group bacterium]|nr:prohibitin family protein [Patescibacteria group bacterium]MBU4337966.1 prohibitin family protein [Patescibacteria group bacterium]MBU4580534.1 prohibitin family protein [Patescibacteria group bacterium]
MQYDFTQGITSSAKFMKTAVLAFIVFMAITILNPFVIVGAGERGVVLTWGAVGDTILDEGLHLVVPIMQKVAITDVKIKKHEVQVVAYSKDLQTVDTVIALNYHVATDSVNKLYQEIGSDFQSRVIDPAIQESVKATTALFAAQDLIEQRPKVKDEIKKHLFDRLSSKYIVIDDFSIVNFDFSENYEKAVEQKQVAQQQALKAENELKRIKIEAEQRIAQAEAEAKAIQIQAQAITQTGGKDYVQLKAVEKWNGQLPQNMIPGGTVPFLDLTFK